MWHSHASQDRRGEKSEKKIVCSFTVKKLTGVPQPRRNSECSIKPPVVITKSEQTQYLTSRLLSAFVVIKALVEILQHHKHYMFFYG